MKYTQGKYQIAGKRALAKDIFSIDIKCPEITEIACPGQFVHILPPGFTLRRPISICDIDKKSGTLRIVFITKGDGTKEIAKLNEGELIDMLAPLGHGFTIDNSFKKIILVGGGIGTPPMLPLAKIYGERTTVISRFQKCGSCNIAEGFQCRRSRNDIMYRRRLYRQKVPGYRTSCRIAERRKRRRNIRLRSGADA